MNVKSYWMETDCFVKPVQPNMPVIGINPISMEGQRIGMIGRVEDGRALVVLDTPVPWQEMEQRGIGFSQFEDTED